MIINESVSSPVVSNIATAPTRFKIKASAKAFKILSGFYSEPILAIPRELGANAWDSHVKAGNTSRMFEVHAPNTLEPWFAIRDFGTGLSPEAIDTIYTTYFESTKTQDNDSDGCMGLGSKTPFNYTENFNVTSFYNGKKHVYNCFIDEQGSPNIMHINTQDSTEHSGLEVKFGVKIADIGMWVDKITRAYEPFRYRPIIKGAKIEYKSREYIYQGKGWAMRKNDDANYYNRGCNAFMGNYCYPINASAFRNVIYTEKLDSALNYGNFDLFFDIGELEVAPNKEQLQYEDNNSTTTAIIAALKNAVAEMKQMVVKNIETPKSRWEAMYLYNKYNSYNSSYSNIRHIIGEIPIKFDNQKITTGNESVSAVHKNAGCLDANSQIQLFNLHVLETLNGKIKRTGTYHPHSETRDVHIFYTNSLSIKKSRLRHYLSQKYTDGKIPTCFVIVDASDKATTLWKHAKYFGWDKSIITDIDSLPKPPAVPRQKKTVGTDEIYYADVSGFFDTIKNNHCVYWHKKSAAFDSAGTYYYIDFYYADAVYGPNSVKVQDMLYDAMKLVVANKIFSETTIYGINMKNKPLLSVGTWINVMDLVKNNVVANKAKYEQELYKINQRVEFEKLHTVYAKLTHNPSIINNIKNDDTRNMFRKLVKTYSSISTGTTINNDMLKLFDIKAVKHDDLDIDPKATLDIIKAKYFNLFTAIDIYSGGATIISNIINFIDEKS